MPHAASTLFRLIKGGKLIEDIFKGETINTPLMLAVEDAMDGLRWAEGIGGLPALIARCERSLAALATWVERSEWAGFLAASPETRSPTSVCLAIRDAAFTALAEDGQQAIVKDMTGLLTEQ